MTAAPAAMPGEVGASVGSQEGAADSGRSGVDLRRVTTATLERAFLMALESGRAEMAEAIDRELARRRGDDARADVERAGQPVAG